MLGLTILTIDMSDTPTCFISYSHDSPDHRDWVTRLADELQRNGVLVRFDRWHLQPGHEISHFMEVSIEKSDFVVLVCTPRYREKANMREGGVGAEAAIVSGELFARQDAPTQAKFVPLLRGGTPRECLPNFATGRFWIDFGDNMERHLQIESLLRHLFGKPAFSAPPLGDPPAFIRATEEASDRKSMPAPTARRPRKRTPSGPTDTAFDRSVFLGLHGGSLTVPFLTAAVLPVVAYGIKPRSVLETSMPSFSRLERLQALIAQCRYSIHDVGASSTSDSIKQNAPFVLGLALGAVTSGAIERRDILVVGNRVNFATISDLSGLDVEYYDGDRLKLLQIIALFIAVRSSSLEPASPAKLAKLLPKLDASVTELARVWGEHPPFSKVVTLVEEHWKTYRTSEA
jgi:hypothetical protein